MTKLLNNQYMIKDMIKKTDFFTIYSGINMNNEKQVFIKKLTGRFPNLIIKAQVMEQFKEEVKFYFNKYENLPEFKDYFDFQKYRYLVVDYIEGKTLMELKEIKNELFTPQRIINLGIKLCDMLQYFHSFTPPIVFNKLYPDDIFLLSNNDIKIFYSGLSMVNNGGKSIQFSDNKYSFFLSPEQYYDNMITSNDIYSLGAVLYYLFTGETNLKTNYHNNLPLYFQRVIRKAMALLIEDRYKTVEDMKHDLEKANVMIQNGEDNGDSIFLKEEEKVETVKKRKTFKQKPRLLSAFLARI